MDKKKRLIFHRVLILFGIYLIPKVDGICNWPAQFQSSQWHDSARGVLTFDVTSMAGWDFTPTSDQTISDWECLINTADTDGRIVLVSNSFTLFSSTYYAYLCITVTKVTDASFRYYINQKVATNLFKYDRLFIYPVNTLTDLGTFCSDGEGASGSEYQVWINIGNEATAKITCPWMSLGRYGYTHTTVAGVTTCDTTTSDWDMCTDNTQMTFNYGTCPTKVAYSNSDTVWCMDNVVVGDNNFLTTYNANDADSDIDDTTVYRFSCFAISSAGDIASVSPQHCQGGQSPGALPTNNDGTTVGATLTIATPTETCVTCPSLANPDRGVVSIATIGDATTATYTCDTSFTLYGSATRTCQTDTWSGDAPFCNCATPATPTNGGISVSSDGSTTTYTCDVGYSLSGLSIRNCQTDTGLWEDTDPTCATCSALADATGRAYTQSSNGTQTQADFTCGSGYTIDGATALICDSDGTWDSALPTCFICDILTNPSSGTVDITSDGSLSTATYTCDTGYSLVGVTARTCQTDGTWDNTIPSCSCNTPSIPANGAVVADGTTATYTCSTNYTLSGAQTRTCQSDGSGWTDADPTCVLCETLASVTGGSVTLTSSGTVTSAKYTCTAGYSLDGTSPLTCNVDGTWSSTPPNCVICPSLDAPSSGTISLSTSGTKSSVTYACASSYDLIGNTIRLCNSDGTWSLTAPICSCTTPTTPLNGFLTEDGNMASYTCSTGFSLNGVSQRSCGADGSGWSDFTPTCTACLTLTSPTGGSVDLNIADGLNTQATFTCNTGYTLSGQSVILCRYDGTWNYNEPTCVKCADLSDPASGSVTTTSTSSVTTATFACVSGYYISGEYLLTCQIDGTWDKTEPSCKCSFPSTPANGAVSVTDVVSGSTASYTCTSGYSLSGLPTRACQTDGTGWEDVDPTCEGCQAVSVPTSGNIAFTTNGTHTNVVYTCEVGTTLSGDTTLVCLSNGQWDKTQPTCVSCPTLTVPSSGSVSLVTDGLTTTATFTCLSGYAISNTSALTCTTAGTWDLPVPSCSCSSPPLLANGEVAVTADLTMATYTCYTGYVLVGSQSRTCQNDTGWSGTAPTCVLEDVPTAAPSTNQDTGDSNVSVHIAVVIVISIIAIILLIVAAIFGYMYFGMRRSNTRVGSTPLIVEDPKHNCNTLTTPAGGSIQQDTDGQTTTANHSCIAGYTILGDSLLTCQPDTTWSPTQPTCVQCDALGVPGSVSVAMTTDGAITSVFYTCVAGYTMVGANTRTCQTDSTWTPDAPACQCDSPVSPLNGGVSANGSLATYTCDLQYSLAGYQTRTCLDGGTGWSQSNPTCSLCDAINNPVGGSYSFTTSSTVTSASVTCNNGYSLNGDVTVSCRDDGTWGTLPNCVECDTLTDRLSGSIAIATTGDVSIATYTCATGYDLNGETTRNCTSSGTWTGTAPTCSCQSPSTPSNGMMTDNGETATYTCTVGYTLNGVAARTCRTDGTGWNDADPICTACSTITAPVGGTYTYTTSGTVTSASATCDSGYTLNGDVTFTCTADGSWETQPICVQCKTLTDPESGSVAITTSGTVSVATYSCSTGYNLIGQSMRNCGTDGTWSLPPSTCSCQSPSIPSNGEVTDDGLTATYTCTVGYTISGVTTRTCLTDGTGWTDNDPTCTLCNSLGSPSGGSYTVSTSGTSTAATFTCDTGYTLSGDVIIMCRDDGSWETSPNCVPCDALSDPESGIVTIATTGTVSIATYTCTTGYNLDGDTNRNCTTTGAWNLSPPMCSCQSPSTPTNSMMTDDGETATYTCTVGYTLNGANTRTCQTDGTGWSDTDPMCTLCSSLTDPVGGVFTPSTSGTVTSASVTCDSGYTLSGDVTVNCQTDGNWQTLPVCDKCDDLTAPDSGSFAITTDGYVSIATYTCATGYDLNGDNTRTCSTSGTWTLTAPACSCQSPSTPSNGMMTDDGLTATYTCTVGYTLSGANTRTCQTDGTRWSNTDPTCSICDTLTPPNGGAITLETNNLETTALFTCDSGYTLNGMTSLTCRADGSWDFSQPVCVICDTLSDPGSGSVTIATSSTVSMATYQCSSGYNLIGQSTRTCGTDGTWTSTAPTCSCQSPSTPNNGEVIDDGLTATYTCTVGYTISGVTTRTCLTDGTGWGDTDPTCTLCNSLGSPSGGSYTVSTSGTSTAATFTCDTGYTLSGDVIIMCRDDGSWETSPACVSCDALSDPESGSVIIATTGTVSIATYTCTTGYNLDGDTNRNCTTTGAWNLSPPMCSCQSPSTPSNGMMTDDGLTATYTCTVGYTLSGTNSRTCQTDGTGWSDTDPTCTLCSSLTDPVGGVFTLSTSGTVTSASVTCDSGYTLNGDVTVNCQTDSSWQTLPACDKCADLTSPDSGSFAITTDGFISIATYTCATGYDINGDNTRTCSTGGTWTLTAPTCSCQSPSTPSNGMMTDDGLTATYTCTVGYTLSGANTRTCQTDGTWWSDTDPTCTICNTLTPPTGGHIALTTNTLMTTALFTCDSGYTLDGSTSLTCRADGSWDFSQPDCVSCPTLTDPSSGSVTLSTNNYTTTASFTCETGYFVSGPLSVTCRSDGQWSEESPSCKCNFPSDPAQGSVSVSQGAVATYSCNLGYSLLGASVRICQEDGTGWDLADPSCSVCDSITTSAELQFVTSTNGSTTVGAYTCSVNYTLKGQSDHTCLSDGTWSDAQPICVYCENRAAPLSGSVTMTTDGLVTIATYSCVSGYSLNSTGITTCQTDGTWDLPNADCLCDPPPALINGEIELLDEGRTANHSCNQDYQLVGSDVRTCVDDGTGWTGTQPICDLIITTLPPAAASTDENVLSFHLGIIVAMVAMIVALVIAVIICTYLRYRPDHSKISATFDDTGTGSQPSVDDMGMDLNKGLSNGKALLIAKESPTKPPNFNVKRLKDKNPASSSDIKFDTRTPPTSAMPNGRHRPLVEDDVTPVNVPIKSVRLPKLPPRTPKTPREADGKLNKPRRKKKRTTPKEEEIVEQRTSTPLEVSMARIDTPEILSTADFTYLKPVFCHEVETPAPSRPATRGDAKGQAEDNADWNVSMV